MPSMSIDDNDFLAGRAKADFGCILAFSPAARWVTAANDLNLATGPTETEQ